MPTDRSPRHLAGARLLACLGLLVVAALSPSPLVAQVRVLDEGSFTIFRGDARIGREDFSIRTSGDAGGGGLISAQATIQRDTQRFLPVLTATAGGTPLSYTMEWRGDGRAVSARWTLQVTGARAVSRQRTDAGESSAEFSAGGGLAALVDDDVAHHLWFLFRNGNPVRTMLVPRRNLTVPVAVAPVGADTVAVGGKRIAARRFSVTPTDPGGQPRELWLDANGRLLQVRVPGANLRYVREEPPAGS
ncbi:MAG: DUF6134 family protein [Gemmatimonadaceae bacterium]|nr:DUF6134 family protein [Gemmatimonadaceae bacterium]